MEKVRQILYQVIGNGQFKSIIFDTKLEAENVAAITRGEVIEIIK